MQTNSPITNLGIVADLSKCPPSYFVLVKSSDKREDCDLWRDGVFKSRTNRYLCFTKTIQKHQDQLQEVLASIYIINDKDTVPDGCRVIDKTMDTLEKSLKKKIICVKMIPRCLTTDAICDIIILSRNRKPPNCYTTFGEINGLVMCYKMCNISSPHQDAGDADDPMLIPDNSTTNSDPIQQHQNTNDSAMTTATATAATNALVYYNDIGSLVINAVYDIPFHVNTHLGMDDIRKNELLHLNGYKEYYDDDNDIEKEFNYDFTVERMTFEL